MLADLGLPLSIVMSTASFALVAVWYVWPWMREETAIRALTPILLVHTFRHSGMAFLITGVTASALDPRFAQPAAYGDLFAALLALTAVHSGGDGSWPFHWCGSSPWPVRSIC